MEILQRMELNRRLLHLMRLREQGARTDEQHQRMCHFTLVEFGCDHIPVRRPQPRPDNDDEHNGGLCV